MDKILLPLDGQQPTAVSALQLAGQLLGEGGILWLLRVLDPLADDSLVNPTAVAESYLADHAARWQSDHPHQTCYPLIEYGRPAERIAAVAAHEQVDLLLMPTQGRLRFGQWLLGGVAEHALRQACCPVLLLRTEAPLTHIGVTLDGSPFAEQVLPVVLAVAAALGSQVTLLQVAGGEEAVVQARDYLEGVTAVWEPTVSLRFPIQSKVIHGRAPAPYIIDYLAAHQIDLLALATHGLSGTLTGMYGSVAEKLLRNVDCSMLILRPNN